MLPELIKLANQLDQKGLYKEADFIDSLVKQAVSQSNLTIALKRKNIPEIQSAFAEFVAAILSYTTAEKELGMTHDDFNNFVKAIRDGRVNTARKLYGMHGQKKDTNLSKFIKDFDQKIKKEGGKLIDISEASDTAFDIIYKMPSSDASDNFRNKYYAFFYDKDIIVENTNVRLYEMFHNANNYEIALSLEGSSDISYIMDIF